MKIKIVILTIILLVSTLAGCGSKSTPPAVTPTPAPTATPTVAPTATPTTALKPDVVTTASVVDNTAAFEKAISSGGTWIIAIIKDLTDTNPLVLDGEYKNGKKDANGKDILQRKVALYAQDANRKITARYTLTAPKFTINSPEASIEHGTFKGDVYVSAKDFKLIDATIDGNLYFTTDIANTSYNIDATSKVTGKKELKK
jgi:predicted small lipoprotein YifL